MLYTLTLDSHFFRLAKFFILAPTPIFLDFHKFWYNCPYVVGCNRKVIPCHQTSLQDKKRIVGVIAPEVHSFVSKFNGNFKTLYGSLAGCHKQ